MTLPSRRRSKKESIKSSKKCADAATRDVSAAYTISRINLSLLAPFIDVPTKEEELKMGDCNGIAPQIAKNAQKLIDFALSFIPPRDGPRRTKEKRRMQLRREQREVG